MRTVLTHRDPYRCLVSTVTMIRSINEPFLDDHSVLDSLPETMTARATRGLAAVSDLDLDGVAHAGYSDLVTDPAAVVFAVHDTLGITTPADLEMRIARFLADQRAGRRAAPPAELPSHGLEQDEIHTVPAVWRYCSRHGVIPERVRLSG